MRTLVLSAGTKESQAESVHWFETEPGTANPTEILLFAFLLCLAAESKEDLDKWVEKVLAQAPRREELGENWTPPEEPDWQGKGKQHAPIYKYMANAYSPKGMSNAWYSNIGEAIQACKLDGSIDGLQDSKRVQRHREENPQGPKYKGHTKPRWCSAIFDVAKLIDQNRAHLHASLKPTNKARQVPSNKEQIQSLKNELKKANAREHKARTDANQARGDRDKAVNGWTQAKKRQTEARKAVAAAVAKERAAAKERVKAAKKAAEEKLPGRIKQAVERAVKRKTADLQTKYENEVRKTKRARERARAVEGEAELSDKRLQRLKAAQAQLRELQQELDALQASDSDSDEDDGCKTDEKSRRDAHGRFEAEPWQMRVLKYAQISRRVPTASIAANISDVLAAYAPELADAPQPTERCLRLIRSEVTIAGEAMAAFRVGKAKRIISFGFDESTKYQLGLLSTNTQIEPHDAPGTSVDVVQRGATLTAGGTAEAVAASIDTKIFSHSRGLLDGWKQLHESRFGDGSWAAAGAPDPSSVGLHRLSEQTVLMGDTCNGERKAKRLLQEMAEAAGRAKIGDAAWDAMSEADRESFCKAHIGDCHQHLRNIIINASACAATEHLQLKLEDDLSEFTRFDRMSVDVMDLIRAIFKELHAGGEYAKGKGREFSAWLKKHHPSALFLPFERAHGSRQDLAFDGAVPIFMNRRIILEFIRGLLVPGATNSLEKFIWRVLSCNEMVATLRVCTLFALLISQPMRWLAGSASQLTDWSIVRANGVLDLTEKAMVAIAATHCWIQTLTRTPVLQQSNHASRRGALDSGSASSGRPMALRTLPTSAHWPRHAALPRAAATPRRLRWLSSSQSRWQRRRWSQCATRAAPSPTN